MSKSLQINVSDKSHADGAEGSVVGPLEMDRESRLTGVALPAYSEAFGARKDDPRFVVTGAADFDMCFAIAALIGYLPHPSRVIEFATTSSQLKDTWICDLTPLAALIDQAAVSRIGLHLEESDDGCMILLWQKFASTEQDATAVYGGVDRWRHMLGLGRKNLGPLLAAIKTEESNRIARARRAHIKTVSNQVILVKSPVWGFDDWLSKKAEVVLALRPDGTTTIVCPDVSTAKRLFGPGGLKNIFQFLEPAGWQGGESIGNSPPGMTYHQAHKAACVLADIARSEEMPPT